MYTRILELSNVEGAAAFFGRTFVHSGIEVIKVEHPHRESPWNPADVYLNAGKRRATLDYQDPADRRVIERIAARCDVVVTDESAAEVDRFDLLSIGGDRPLHISITPFGLSGPYRDWDATDATLLAMTGHTWLAGDPGRPPLTMPWRYPSYQAGQFAYVAAMSEALRSQGDLGTKNIEISVHECLASLHQGTDTMWLFDQQLRNRSGNSFYNGGNVLLPCRDGWYEVSAGQNFWVAFVHMIGHPELMDDKRYSTVEARTRNSDALHEIYREALSDWPVERIMREGQEVWRVPIGYIPTFSELLNDEQLTQAAFWQPIEGDERLRVPSMPARVRGEPRRPGPAISAFGRDTDAIVTNLESLRGATAAFAKPTRAAYQPSLSGVRVLDMTRVWAGPLATRILGDLGADVIKIEAPSGRGSAAIPDESSPRPWNRQPLFNKLNRNKRSVAIDLKKEQGRDLFLRLVSEVDVVIENFSPRAMPSLGLGYDRLREVNERLIYMAMPAYGLTGPRRDYIGFGSSIEPTSGATTLMGYSTDEPRITAAGVTDPMAGTVAAGAVLAALERRDRTGEGALVEFAQQQAGIGFIGEYLIDYQITGQEPKRLGNGHRVYAPHGIYRCEGDDEWISIGARNQKQWLLLSEVAGRGWENDRQFVDIESRLVNRIALDGVIDAWTTGWNKWELTNALQSRSIPAGPVLNAAEWLEDEHLITRGYFSALDHPEMGRCKSDGSPILFDGGRGAKSWVAAPLLGAHNTAVLRDLLGLDESAIQDLYNQAVIVDRPPE